MLRIKITLGHIKKQIQNSLYKIQDKFFRKRQGSNTSIRRRNRKSWKRNQIGTYKSRRWRDCKFCCNKLNCD